MLSSLLFFFFFFNDPATTEIYTLSLHDALPIYRLVDAARERGITIGRSQIRRLLLKEGVPWRHPRSDRKSTRLNSSHVEISYAVFCLKKKKQKTKTKQGVPHPERATSPRQPPDH